MFQLTAFGGFLKYTVSYDIPMETVDSDLVSHADVIIKVIAFTLPCYGSQALGGGDTSMTQQVQSSQELNGQVTVCLLWMLRD